MIVLDDSSRGAELLVEAEEACFHPFTVAVSHCHCSILLNEWICGGGEVRLVLVMDGVCAVVRYSFRLNNN